MKYKLLSSRVYRRSGITRKNMWTIMVRFLLPGRKYGTKSKSIKAKSHAEAQRKLEKWVADLQKYDFLSENETMEEFCDSYLKRYCETKMWAPRTTDSYKRLASQYIKPFFGKYRLIDISSSLISEFIYNIMTEDSQNTKQRRSIRKRLNIRTVKNIYYLLSQIMRTAYQLDKIPSNPMDKVPAPSNKRDVRTPAVFSKNTLALLFKHLEMQDPLFQLQILLCVTTGCRIGELLGLSWNDYNELNHTFYVHQTVQYIPGRGTYIYAKPKTPNSYRNIYVIPQLWSALEVQKQEFLKMKKYGGEEWNPSALLFYNVDGSPLRPNNISNKFCHFIKKNNLPHIRFHDLRGYFATMLMQTGHSLPDIIKKTGHSKASTLLDYYGHALIESQAPMNSTIENSFEQISTPLLKQLN